MKRELGALATALLIACAGSARAAPGDWECFQLFFRWGHSPADPQCIPNVYGTPVDLGTYYCVGAGGAAQRFCGWSPKNSGPPDDCSAVGNPINASNGNKFNVERDIDGYRPTDLRFDRYYNALAGDAALNSASAPELGNLWRHSYSKRVKLIQPLLPKDAQPLVTATRPDGKQWTFIRDPDGSWSPYASPELSASLVLLQSGGNAAGWQLTDYKANSVETYNIDGLLTKVAPAAGAFLELVYNGDSQLEAVRRSIDSRELLLAYNVDGQLSTVTSPDGRVTSFEYSDEPSVFNRDLITVIRPDLTPDPLDNPRRSYTYDEPEFSAEQNLFHLLTGVHDERQVRVGTYRYSSDRRAIGTEQALGANAHQVSYSNGVAQVTLPLGAQATMTFANIAGSLRMQTNTQPTCAGPLATKSVEFDARANPVERRDFIGTRTCSAFDAQRNLETVRVDGLPTTCPTNLAAYTPPAQTGNVTIRKTSTNWHPHWHLPIARAEPKRITRWIYNGQPDPSQGNAIASCAPASATVAGLPIAALCRVIEQATNDPTGGQGFAAPSVGPPRISSYNYNANGQVLEVNGPRTDVGDITTFEYRAADAPGCATTPTTCAYRRGDLWKVTNALSQVIEHVAYDGAGRLRQLKDANGTFTDLTYHPRGWLLTRTVRASASGVPSSGDATISLDYDAAGNVTKVTQPDGTFLRYWYDDASRVSSISESNTEGAGNRIVFALDAAGNRIKETTYDAGNAVQRQMARQYNELSQLRSLINARYADQANLDDPLVKKTTFTYDANGNLDLSTDPLNTVTDHDYDALNRLIKTIGDEGTGSSDINATTQFEYDGQGNLSAVRDPKSLLTSYAYNGLGNLSPLSSPDTGVTNFTYDTAGNRTSQTDARNVTASYGYDALNRLTSITYPDAAFNITFAYDQPTSTTGCSSSFPVGRLTRFTDQTGSTTFCYDRRGNVTRKTQASTTSSLALEFTYNTADRVETITYPDGGRVRYGRDIQGRIDRVWWRPAGSTAEIVVIAGADYYAFGPLRLMTFGNGRTLTKTYDQNYWAATVAGSPSGLSLNFDRDDYGNVVGLTGGTAANDRVYDYDDLHRLKSVQNGTGAGVEAYTYDATGNRLTKSVGAYPPIPYVYPASSHRLASVDGLTRSYDAAGNTTADFQRSFTYDQRGRLVSVSEAESGQLATYQYNARGERVRKVSGNLDRQFLYDESGRLIGEYTPKGKPIQALLWFEEQPIAVIDGGSLRYVETDHLNTPRTLIDPARNIAVWRWDLQDSAFGEWAANEDPDGDAALVKFNLRFPGQYLDEETGLHYNYLRDYDPSIGRYLESDPIGLSGGISTYWYAGQNPYRFIDPQGLFFDESRQFVQTCVERTVSASTRLLGGASLMIWSPSLSQCQDPNPPADVQCADDDDRCTRAINDLLRILRELRTRSIPQYMHATRHNEADQGHYNAIVEGQRALQNAINRVRRWCKALPPELSAWERLAGQDFPVRH